MVALAADFFSTLGDALSPEGKSLSSTHKSIPPFVQAQKENSA
jgi:hypothetical protein